MMQPGARGLVFADNSSCVLGHLRAFDYDVAGNLLHQPDRNGLITTFTYDAVDRLTAERWWDGDTLVNTLTYTCDAAGNRLSVNDHRMSRWGRRSTEARSLRSR